MEVVVVVPSVTVIGARGHCSSGHLSNCACALLLSTKQGSCGDTSGGVPQVLE